MVRSRADDKLVLVKHEPGIKAKRRMLIGLTAVIFGLLGYVFAVVQIGSAHDALVEKLVALEMSHDHLSRENSKLSQQVTNLESGRAIDDLAKQEIQTTIRTLKANVTNLQKDVTFYQGIMAPSDNARGLQLRTVEIRGTAQQDYYDYKLVLAQIADNKNYVSGIVAINLIGQSQGEQVVMPLRDISELTELGIKFRFRYFQDFEGELRLPEDFKPESLQVVAQSKGKKASRLEQSFNWETLLSKGS